jgi:soluble lytic murein transglycosylase-like protein
VIAVESRYNPIAESVMGAKGLMQIMPQFHLDKLQHWGGAKAVFEPEANIAVGARIIREYLGRTRDMTEALQMYAGAADDADSVYAKRVFGEQQRLKQVVKPFEDAAPRRAAAPVRASPAS